MPEAVWTVFTSTPLASAKRSDAYTTSATGLDTELHWGKSTIAHPVMFEVIATFSHNNSYIAN